jgi:single-strand DNA-binding protein
MNIELQCKIKEIKPVETFGSGFQKRVVIVEEVNPDEMYPQTLPIEFIKDKCALLDQFKVGGNCTIALNLRGSEYKGRHFVNLVGWKIYARASDERRAELDAASEPSGELPDAPY